MPSSTSSSEPRFLAALAATFLVLVAGWEGVLRKRASATVEFAIYAPEQTAKAARGEQWVVFGNCLMMTGISPARLKEQLGDDHDLSILNIAAHEQSPIAYFDYLRRSERYPDVVVANVSSWINGTNFEQEAKLVARANPLGLAVGATETAPGEHAPARPPPPSFQQRVEGSLTDWTGKRSLAVGHRYHLFDYLLFAGALASTASLDDALYQLNMQSWFRVTGSETDGSGFLGLHVWYRDDWSTGVERMAERSLQRLKLSRLLNDRFWALLEDHVRHFRAHGTEIVLVRMPEHPRIREFNDGAYDLPRRLPALAESASAVSIDLSRMGVSDGVRLFDAVHPDAAAAEVITREVAARLRARGFSVRQAATPRPTGGG